MSDTLDEAIHDMLETIIEGGGSLPILMAAVALNESMLYVRFESGGVPATKLAEHIVQGVFATPITAMFVDAEGRAYRMSLTQQGVHLTS